MFDSAGTICKFVWIENGTEEVTKEIGVMASSEVAKFFVQGQLRPLGEDVTVRKMMGEYILHYRSRVLGFISNDVLILEDGPTIQRLLPDAERVPLFPGSKDFVVFPDPGNSRLLCEVVTAIYEDLPVPKPRKSKRKPSENGPAVSEKKSGGEDDPIEDFLKFHRKNQ